MTALADVPEHNEPEESKKSKRARIASPLGCALVCLMVGLLTVPAGLEAGILTSVQDDPPALAVDGAAEGAPQGPPSGEPGKTTPDDHRPSSLHALHGHVLSRSANQRL